MDAPDIDTGALAALCILQEFIDRVPGRGLVDGDLETNFVRNEQFLETYAILERVGTAAEEVRVGGAHTADIPVVVSFTSFFHKKDRKEEMNGIRRLTNTQHPN